MKGIYSDAVIVATVITVMALLILWAAWAIAGSLAGFAIVGILIWRVTFLWCMDT